LNDQVKQLKGEIESNEETLGVTEDELNKTRNNYNEQRCMLLFLRAHQPKSVYLLLSSLNSRVDLDDPESVQNEIQRLEANVVNVDMSQPTEAEQLISLDKELADEREISQFLRSQLQFKSKECSDQTKELQEMETEKGDLAKDLEKIKKERWSKTAVFIVGVSFIALGAYWRRLSPPSLTSLVDRINERVSSFIEQHWQSIKPAIYSFSRDTQAHAENFRSKIIYALYKK
ncbi:MAG: hypothetical protein HYZ47_05640, partial [Simkania negevensis]|nr:hypothetical protein [Simkania negevensis]